MFKEVNKNNVIYIIDKTKGVCVSECIVTDKSPSRMDPSSLGKIIIDLTVEHAGTQKIYQVPEMSSVASIKNDEILIVSDKDAMIREVEGIKTKALIEIECVEKNRTTISQADDILSKYSPIFREKRETEERFVKIEDNIEELKKIMLKLSER